MQDDRGLMREVARRDQQAFGVLVERFGGRLLAVARRLLGSDADAEDAVQRALLNCYLHADTYRPEWAVSTWLYRILTNVCVDEMRRSSRRTRGTERLHQDAATVDGAAAGRDPGLRMDMARALARVPREARVLLALRYVDDLSYGELARVRGISVNTVKSQLARGKVLLRAALRDDAGARRSRQGERNGA